MSDDASASWHSTHAGSSATISRASARAATPLAATVTAPPADASDTKKLRSDTRLVHMLRNAVEAASGDDGWANLGAVGSQVGEREAAAAAGVVDLGCLPNRVAGTDVLVIRRHMAPLGPVLSALDRGDRPADPY